MATTRRKEEGLENGLVQTVFKPCAKLLMRYARPQAGERLLDVGCGSGIVVRAAIEQQPQLGACSGFDFEPAAVEVAQQAASRHPGADKMSFWRGDAKDPAAYAGGNWDICIAQHVLQHVPEMLEPLRAALAQGGRAVIATWPSGSQECPAYSFLYRASGDGDHPIGLAADALREKMHQAGFRDVSVSKESVATPPIEPRTFLRQYLQGKQIPPTDLEDVVTRANLDGLVKEKAASVDASGAARFEIVMYVAIAAK